VTISALNSAPDETAGIVNALEGTTTHRDPMNLSAGSLDELARIVDGEGNVCSDEGMIAIAAVVLNRVRAGYADGTVHGVISEKEQFPSYGDATYRRRPSARAIAAAQAAAGGEDPSNGALFYFNPYLVDPSWKWTMHETARIGTDAVDTHVFYTP
jgi:N-acetylmuramoyl-L-alanine amidase